LLAEQRAYVDPRDGSIRLIGGVSDHCEGLAAQPAPQTVTPEDESIEFAFPPSLVDFEVDQLRYRGAIEILGKAVFARR
jgi:hypothetical protein